MEQYPQLIVLKILKINIDLRTPLCYFITDTERCFYFGKKVGDLNDKRNTKK